MRTVSPEERETRAELVEAQILLDAIELNPLRSDRFRMAVLRRRIAQLTQQVHVIRAMS